MKQRMPCPSCGCRLYKEFGPCAGEDVSTEAVERDAARYRWLRDRTCVADGVFRCFEADKLQLIGGNDLTGSQRLDAAIDAAMRQSAPDQRHMGDEQP